MEYIDGHGLNSNFVRAASRDAQLEMVGTKRRVHLLRELIAGDLLYRFRIVGTLSASLTLEM